MLPIVHDRWDQYHTFSNGKVLFISFDVESAQQDLSHELPLCARIIVRIKSPNQNGGPSGTESERLYAMEDQLCDLLAAAQAQCRLVGRITHDGTREIVFQLQDFAAFRPPVGWWMQQHKDYPIEVAEHQDWDFFNEVIRPTEADWQWMRDRDVVEQLTKAGSNPSKPHDLDFTFCGDVDGLRRVAAQLAKRGYTAEHNLDFNRGSFTAVKRMPLDVDEIHGETMQNSELATAYGVEFSGWGAMVVK